MGIKKCRIWCWYQIHWKGCKKNHAKKVPSKKVAQKLTFWLLLLFSKDFSLILLLRESFAFFPTDSNSVSSFTFLIPIWSFFATHFFLFLALFATFKPNIDKTANVPKYSISHPSSQKVKIVLTYCTGFLSKSKWENVKEFFSLCIYSGNFWNYFWNKKH